MDRVSDEKLAEMIHYAEKDACTIEVDWSEGTATASQKQFAFDRLSILRELQARRAQRCETCGQENWTLCNLLEGCSAWQAKEGNDAKVDPSEAGDVPR